jgi:hypothetical protein
LTRSGHSLARNPAWQRSPAISRSAILPKSQELEATAQWKHREFITLLAGAARLAMLPKVIGRSLLVVTLGLGWQNRGKLLLKIDPIQISNVSELLSEDATKLSKSRKEIIFVAFNRFLYNGRRIAGRRNYQSTHRLPNQGV